MKKYQKIVTDAGIAFEVGKRGIVRIQLETKQGAASGFINIYKAEGSATPVPAPRGRGRRPKGTPADEVRRAAKVEVLHAQVIITKIDTYYIT